MDTDSIPITEVTLAHMPLETKIRYIDVSVTDFSMLATTSKGLGDSDTITLPNPCLILAMQVTHSTAGTADSTQSHGIILKGSNLGNKTYGQTRAYVSAGGAEMENHLLSEDDSTSDTFLPIFYRNAYAPDFFLQNSIIPMFIVNTDNTIDVEWRYTNLGSGAVAVTDVALRIWYTELAA